MLRKRINEYDMTLPREEDIPTSKRDVKGTNYQQALKGMNILRGHRYDSLVYTLRQLIHPSPEDLWCLEGREVTLNVSSTG